MKPRPQGSCPTCDILGREYAHAAAEHVKLLMESQIALITGRPTSERKSKREKKIMRCRFTFVAAKGLLTALAISGTLAAQEQSKQQGQQEHKHHRYTLKHLGTFGGPASYFSGDYFGGRTL